MNRNRIEVSSSESVNLQSSQTSNTRWRTLCEFFHSTKCMWIISLSIIATLMILAICIPTIVIMITKQNIRKTISATKVTATTTSTTTISTTTGANPCAFGDLGWNRTGITVFSSSAAVRASNVYFDSNDALYITDEDINYVIWKLFNNAVNATIVAGTAGVSGYNSTQLNNPNDAYVDKYGNMYVCDTYNYRIQKYSNGSIHGITIAGITGSSGSSLNQLNYPRHFTFDSTDSYMYIADHTNSRVMRYSTNSTSGTDGTIMAGGTGAGNTNTSLNYPWGIHSLSSVSNDLYVVNHLGHSVMRWTPGASSGVFIAGIPGVEGSTSTLLNGPKGIKVDTYLNIYVVDHNNHRIQMFCANRQTATTIAGNGIAGNSATQLSAPRGIAFDKAMNMYVADFDNRRVQKFLKL